MDSARAERVVAALRTRGVIAHVERAGVYQFGIRVRLDQDRVAIWDTDGTADLEAQVMRNGVLINFVPSIPGSQHFTDEQVVQAIATADYDRPVTTAPPPKPRPAGTGGTAGPAGARPPVSRTPKRRWRWPGSGR
jgi:hypothetical protein